MIFIVTAVAFFAGLYFGALLAPGLPMPKPAWIVNNRGEAGIQIHGRYFFCYNGDCIEYQSDPAYPKQLVYRPLEKGEGIQFAGDLTLSDAWHKLPMPAIDPVVATYGDKYA